VSTGVVGRYKCEYWSSRSWGVTYVSTGVVGRYKCEYWSSRSWGVTYVSTGVVGHGVLHMRYSYDLLEPFDFFHLEGGAGVGDVGERHVLRLKV
jgi:hypothetical protein